ncbi:hypothetical protein B0H67DRAFT_583614 [Lasiosphaeris hirsuta]|uniref:Uncharacterized protein n=1 Tax=Lasiosphaeris hirsuta TaxID=260670 RepID=A0AA40A7T0_9PEZI|nr:hypothetical protein B0H67DRAFT_583614 [Lasiosphaeris hirsuta]
MGVERLNTERVYIEIFQCICEIKNIEIFRNVPMKGKVAACLSVSLLDGTMMARATCEQMPAGY